MSNTRPVLFKIDDFISMNTTKETENIKKDNLTQNTKRSYYITSKVHAEMNPDILCGSDKTPVLFGNKYKMRYYNLGDNENPESNKNDVKMTENHSDEAEDNHKKGK